MRDPKMGFFTCCLLAGILSYPLHVLGFSDTVCAIVGIPAALLVYGYALQAASRRRISEMRAAFDPLDPARNQR